MKGEKKATEFLRRKKKAQKLNSNIRLQYRRPQTNCGGGSNFWSVRLMLSKTDLPCFYDKSFRFEKWHIFYHWSTVIHEREFRNQSNSTSDSSIIWKQPQNSEDIQSGYLSWIILSERSFHWGESFLHFRFYNFPQIITLAKASRAALRQGLRCGAGAWLLLLTHTQNTPQTLSSFRSILDGTHQGILGSRRKLANCAPPPTSNDFLRIWGQGSAFSAWFMLNL